MNELKIGYFADGPWSHHALNKLLSDDSVRIVFICARYDHPDPVLRQRAQANEIPFLVHENINSAEFVEHVGKLGCDIFVSMSFNQIFREQIMNLPPRRTINCHAGKLPFYRGRNILNWALINDEPEFGITVHYVDRGIDTGDIIMQRSYLITDEDDYSTLLERAYVGCAAVLYDSIKAIQEDRAEQIPQDRIHPTGFYCSARIAGDEKINWDQSSREIFNFVRALCKPGPQALTYCGGEEVRVNRVMLLPEAPVYKGIAGAVVGVDGSAVLVKTRDSFVRVVEWSGPPKLRIGDRLQ